MITLKSPEELSSPEKMNKVFKNVDDKLAEKLSLDKSGNLVIKGDVICRDLYAEEESVYLGKKKLTAAHISTNENEDKTRDLLRYSFMMG